MEELNLQQIWNVGQRQAQQHYAQLRGNIFALAHQKSQTVFASIYRNTKFELGLGFVLMLGMSIFLWDVPIGLFVLFVSYSIVSLWISFRFFQRFRKSIEGVVAYNVLESLGAKIALLQSYKQHLWQYSVSLIPFTVLIGFIGGYCKGSSNRLASIFETNVLPIAFGAIVVLMLLGYALLKWYFRTFLDKKIKTLEEIQEELTSTT